MLLLKSASPDRNTQQINLKELGLLSISNQNMRINSKLSGARSPSTAIHSHGFNRDSMNRSLNESILNEKTANKEELMRNLMPS